MSLNITYLRLQMRLSEDTELSLVYIQYIPMLVHKLFALLFFLFWIGTDRLYI